MLLSLHADYVMAHTLWPLSPGQTPDRLRWLFHPEAAASPASIPTTA